MGWGWWLDRAEKGGDRDYGDLKEGIGIMGLLLLVGLPE
jgi:hypothetical protein